MVTKPRFKVELILIFFKANLDMKPLFCGHPGEFGKGLLGVFIDADTAAILKRVSEGTDERLWNDRKEL